MQGGGDTSEHFRAATGTGRHQQQLLTRAIGRICEQVSDQLQEQGAIGCQTSSTQRLVGIIVLAGRERAADLVQSCCPANQHNSVLQLV